MTKSKVFFYFCLSFIFGIFLSSITVISQFLILGILIAGLILIFVLWKHKKMVIAGFCLLFLILGICRCQAEESKMENNNLRKYNDLERNIILKGTIVSEPDARDSNQKLTVKPEIIYFSSSERRNIEEGKVLITTENYPEYKYGDKIGVLGELKTPVVFEDFNYKDYLAKQGIYSVIYCPEVELLERGKYEGLISTIYAGMLNFKGRLRESIYQNLSSSQSSILGAMLLGDKSRMSQDLKEDLNIAGVRHVTAVSGMHVVILSTVLMSLLIGLGLWRGQAFYFSIILISLFVVLTGAHSSAIRAGIMGGLFLLAQKVGRRSVSSRTIVMAAAVMLFANPLLLLGDVGFQLSFLAAIGIIHFGGALERWLRFVPNRFINLRSIISMTLAAQIFTLPILVYNFGRISLVSPATNILILPVIYWIMVFGFVFGLLGITWNFLGLIFAIPAWLLLTYLLKVVDFFSQPWAAKEIENVHWIWLVVSYIILGSLIWYLRKKEKLKFLNY